MGWAIFCEICVLFSQFPLGYFNGEGGGEVSSMFTSLKYKVCDIFDGYFWEFGNLFLGRTL